MATLYTAAYLDEMLVDELRRPANDNLLTPEKRARYLTEAQNHWLRVVTQHAPELNEVPRTKMQTADDGETYYFGDPADPIEAIGNVKVFASPTGELLSAGPDFGANDYVFEGTHIRFPHGRKRTFSDGPYARFVPIGTPVSNVVGSVSQPVLKPDSARVLLVYRAAILFAEGAGRIDPTPFLAKEARAWAGTREMGDHGILGSLKGRPVGQTDGSAWDDKWWHHINTGADYPPRAL